MITKLAALADALDELGLMKEADKLTAIMERCAQMYVFSAEDQPFDFEEVDEDPSQNYTFPGEELRWNREPRIEAFSPGFLQDFERHNPRGYEQFRPIVEGPHNNRVQEKTRYMHGTPIDFEAGRGTDKELSPGLLSNFLYRAEDLDRNEKEVQDRLRKRTRGHGIRGRFDLEGYASGSAPEKDEDIDTFLNRMRAPRDITHDPKLWQQFMDWMKMHQREGGEEGFLPGVFDTARYNQLFNPHDPDFASENPFPGVKHTPQQLRDMVGMEDEKTGNPRTLGWLASHARKKYKPGQAFGIGTHPRPTMPDSNKKVPNFYYPGK